MNYLIKLIRAWAEARNLIAGSTAVSQYAKLMSEAGEIAAGIKNESDTEVTDGVGDCFVVLVIICAIAGIDMEECCANVMVVPPHPSNALDYKLRQDEYVWLTSVLGRLGDALLKKDNEQGKHLVASAVRYLSTIALSQCQTLSTCVQVAYDEIKDRKGVMFNGTFIKATDPSYASAMAELGKEGA